MSRISWLVHLSLALAVLGSCASTEPAREPEYSITSGELGFDDNGRIWETERYPDSSVLRVFTSGWLAAPALPGQCGGFEGEAFSDLAWQRGFQWWQVERHSCVESAGSGNARSATYEYVVSFSNRDVVAEQPTFPLNMQPHGGAKRADRSPPLAGDGESLRR
jgi:hypothetical protein